MLVTPRDGPPYQELLYREIEAAGVRVRFTDGPTPSQTLNILVSPAVLVWRRLAGYQILHIHWVFQFSLPWARRTPWARHVMEWWFGFYLWSAHAVRYSIVWTAHDLLPHEQVFANDARARDRLIASAHEIIALSEATANELRTLGAREVRVIPFGSYASPYPVHDTDEEARASFGFSKGDVVLALIGRLEPYKGADLLLRAIAKLPDASRIKVLLAGSCSEVAYQKELGRLAGETHGRVVTRFERIANDDLARYFQAADVAIFPFREITNSGSALLALSFAKPIVIPNLATLRDIPVETAIRFEPGEESLVAALGRAENLSAIEYHDMSAAALSWATKIEWADAAQETIETYESAVSHRRSRFNR